MPGPAPDAGGDPDTDPDPDSDSDSDPGADTDPDSDPGADGPTGEDVVETASDAAEGVVFARYKQSELRDLDVTVRFEDGVLEVDVYLDPPEGVATEEAERVADDAALAARGAVDRLFADDHKDEDGDGDGDGDDDVRGETGTGTGSGEG